MKTTAVPRLLVSSDLNGTLVHQHTMSDMIKLYVGEAQFAEANAVFNRQTNGDASMEEAFGTAGPLTRGITLRQAIRYVQYVMKYVENFERFCEFLKANNIPLVINSTGYSVTIYGIMAQVGYVVHGQIGNILHFGMKADPARTISEEELKENIRLWFANPKACEDPVYGGIKATGEITLGITDEDAKASLIREYAEKHFPGLTPEQIVHIGDTMGDSGGILGVVRNGGTGIAFNYNPALEKFLLQQATSLPEGGADRVHFIDPKEQNTSDLANVIPVLKQLL